MKFVITGATSFIGLELINYLLASNHKVIAVCRTDSGRCNLIPQGVEIFNAEMSDYRYLNTYLPVADVFINLAWAGSGHGGRDDPAIQEKNILYSKDAIILAKQIGCKLFVEAGSQAEYGSTIAVQKEDNFCNPFSEYGKAKLQVKSWGFKFAEEHDIKYMHLRIFSLFGENDHSWTLVMNSLDKMLANEPIELSPCTQNWNFLYVKDAVKIIVDLCRYAVNSPAFKHEIYNIASKDTRVLKSFVEEMKELSKSNSELKYGAISPQTLISLQPDITKMLNDSGFIHFYEFGHVIKSILLIKRKNDKND